MRPWIWAVGAVVAASLACAGGEEAPPEPLEQPEPEQADPEPEEPEEPEIERDPLQAFVVTSNPDDGPNLLDGDPSTSWAPTGDAAGEGVLLRFEEPEKLTGVAVDTCGDPVEVQLYANGHDLGVQRGESVRFDIPRGNVKVVFLKVVSGAKACLAEVRAQTSVGDLAMAPPRSVEARVEVSSTLEPEAAYHASYLFDGRPHFAWVEGAKGSGEGENIQLTFRSDMRIDAIQLWNGYHRSKDHYEKNARVRKLEIEAEGRRVMVDVPEGMVPRKLTFDPALSARQVTISVAAAKKGTKYEDLVVSELRLWDREGPYTVKSMEPNRLREKLMDQIKGKPLAKVVDKTYRQICGQEREFKLRSDNSFVYYERETEGDVQRQVVLDGAWSPVKKGLKLYGRRHVAEQEFAPYGGGEERDSVEVAGGSLTVIPLKSLGKEEAVKKLTAWAKGGAKDRVECLMDGRKLDGAKVKGLLQEGQVLVIEGDAVTDLMHHKP